MATYPSGWLTQALEPNAPQVPVPGVNPLAPVAQPGAVQPPPQVVTPTTGQAPYTIPTPTTQNIAGYNPLASSMPAGYASWLAQWQASQGQAPVYAAPQVAPQGTAGYVGGDGMGTASDGGPVGSGANAAAGLGAVGTGMGGFGLSPSGVATANTTGFSDKGAGVVGGALATALGLPGILGNLAFSKGNQAVNAAAQAAAQQQTANMADTMGANAQPGLAATAGPGGTGGAAAAAASNAAAAATAAGFSDAAIGAASQAAANAAMAGADAAAASDEGMAAASVAAGNEAADATAAANAADAAAAAAGDTSTSTSSDASTASDAASSQASDSTSTGSTWAKGGYVSKKRLVGPNPKGPDDGYGGLDDGEFVIPAKIVRKLGRKYFEDLIKHK